MGWHIRPKRAKAAPSTSELPARIALRLRDAHGAVPAVEVRAGGTAVGVTDATGELLLDVTPGAPTTLDVWTAGGLPVGAASAPLLALAGETRAEIVTLACGGLALELPEGVALTPRTALALQLSSPDLPAPGWVALTLRGGGSGATVKGVRWSGRRVELPHLAPATFDVSLDVLEATSDAPRARLLPTDQHLGARATVRTSVTETYPLTAR
ncbi:MAG: hypothetical protein H6828_12170 [Planctomycetes bacterium]|nr:hypothetical protein [Planctomycetota bacterium]